MKGPRVGGYQKRRSPESKRNDYRPGYAWAGPETRYPVASGGASVGRVGIGLGEETGFAAKEGKCISRAGRPRPDHDFDADGVCHFCDVVAS